MIVKNPLKSLPQVCKAGLKTRYFITGLVGAYVSSFSAHAQQKPDGAESIRHQREQAVLAARAGKLMEAIEQLERLSLQAPKDAAVKSDLIVLLRQAGRNMQINHISRTLLPDTLADYALIPLVDALRDTQAYDRAELLLLKTKQRMRIKPSALPALSEVNLDICLSQIRVESGQKQAARRTVNAISRQHLSASQYARIAYVYRQLDDPLTCLNNTDIALSMDAGNRLALEQMVAALSDIGASTRAYDIARQYPEIFPAHVMQRLHADLVIVQLKDAVSDYKRLTEQGPGVHGLRQLERSIGDIGQILSTLSPASPQYLTLRYEQIYALQVRGQMHDVVTIFQQLTPEQQQQAPAHVRRALADAWLALQQPVQALALYQQLLNENEQPDDELYTAAYFAYIGSENYRQAAPVVQQVVRKVPDIQYSDPPTIANRVNWQHLDAHRLMTIDSAYRHQLAKAEKQPTSIFQPVLNSRGWWAVDAGLVQELGRAVPDVSIGAALPCPLTLCLKDGVGHDERASHCLQTPWRYQLSHARRAGDTPLRSMQHTSIGDARGMTQPARQSAMVRFSYRMWGLHKPYPGDVSQNTI